MKPKHECTVENAPKFLAWIKNRGGVAVWQSLDMSNPGQSWSTPATIRKGDCDGQTGDEIIPYPKPTWRAASAPERVITSTDEVLVCVDKEVERFHIGIRRGSNGMTFKVTDAGTHRIRAAVAKAGELAHYQFDYETQEVIILAPEKTMTLTEWAKENPQGA